MLSLGQEGKNSRNGRTLILWEYPNEIKHKRNSLSLGSPIMSKEQTYPRTSCSLHFNKPAFGFSRIWIAGLSRKAINGASFLVSTLGLWCIHNLYIQDPGNCAVRTCWDLSGKRKHSESKVSCVCRPHLPGVGEDPGEVEIVEKRRIPDPKEHYLLAWQELWLIH